MSTPRPSPSLHTTGWWQRNPRMRPKRSSTPRLAGDAALEALAPIDAVRWFSQALELQERQLSGEAMVRCDLLIGLGTAQQLAGLAEERETLLEAAELARGADDGDRLVRVAFGLARGSQVYDADEARIATLRAALERVEPESTDAARLHAMLTTEIDPRDHEAVSAEALRAIEIARRAGDECTLLEVLNTAWDAAVDHADLRQRRATADTALELADRLDARLHAFTARYHLVELLVNAGDIETARGVFDEAVERAAALGLPYPRWQVLIDQSAFAAMAGDLAGAEALAEAALELATAVDIAAGMGVYGGQLVSLRFIQGRVDEVIAFFVEAAEAMPTIEPLRLAVIVLLIETGDIVAASARFEYERDRGFHYSMTGEVQTLVDAADCAVNLGDREAAGVLFERLARFGEQVAFTHAVAPNPVARARARLAALLGRHDEAEDAFALALTQCGRLAAPYWAARTHAERAEMYARRDAAGDRERAERDLEAALRLASQCGAVAVERRVERVRAELG